MLPKSSRLDHGHGGPGESVARRDFSVKSRIGLDGDGVSFRNLGVGLFLAASYQIWAAAAVMAIAALDLGGISPRPMIVAFGDAALCLSIGDVVVPGSQEQMGRVAALPVVAPVKHPNALGNRSIVQYPRESAGVDRAAASPAEPKIAITSCREPRRPFPTFSRRPPSDLGPKSSPVRRLDVAWVYQHNATYSRSLEGQIQWQKVM